MILHTFGLGFGLILGIEKIGFGTWRFFLAFLVAISHLWAGMLDGPAAYAVWGFFVLSGYLMTKILKDKYGFTKKGLKSYGFNRCLRILPLYYIAALFGLVTILVLGNDYNLQLLNPSFAIPQGFKDIMFNVTLLPIFPSSHLLVAVSGALGTEFGVYIIMPFLAKHKTTAWVVLIISIVINCNYGFTIDSFAARYSLFGPCLFAFSVGSLIAHYRDLLKKYSHPIISIILWLFHCLLWYDYPYWPWEYGIYVSCFLSAWVIISLDKTTNCKVDKLLGDLSYPIYLIHTTIAAWFIPIYGYERNLEFFIASFAVTIVISLLLIYAVDNKIQRRKIIIKEGTNCSNEGNRYEQSN